MDGASEDETDVADERQHPAAGRDDRSADSTTESDSPVAVGDGREKHVRVVTRAGERHDHGAVYLKQSSVAFLVSSEQSFPEAATTRYEKDRLRRVEVTQHHAACFITTAAAGEGPALDALREFRDTALLRSSVGRALVALYDAASPPIAATLARHPDTLTTRFIAALVRCCGALARRRTRVPRPARAVLTVVLVALYAVGMGCGLLGHLALRLRERG